MDLDNEELESTLENFNLQSRERQQEKKLQEYKGIIIGLSLTLILYMVFSIYLFCRLVGWL